MPTAFERLRREPLLHFAVLGLALFALERFAHRDGDDDDTRIVLGASVRAELADGFAEEHGRPPSDEELRPLIASWVRQEVLYREGLARGLERGDPRVRSEVAGSMASVLRAELAEPTPSDDDLRAYFEAHRERYDVPARVDFTQVFVSSHRASSDGASGDGASSDGASSDGASGDEDARAAEILAQLRGGASPNGLGDVFPGGRRYRGRRIEDLAEQFGAPFVDGLADQPVGTWTPRRSRFGIHLVRVDRVRAASDAALGDARLDVLRDWTEEARQRELDRVVDELAARYVVEEP
ncbi:MAG: peptidyl-prolyl cis-trans isomerase [Sandaracinaceae bacterium]